MQAPKIDPRSYREIMDKAVELARHYLPEWQGIDDQKDPGRAMLELFARLMELLIARLNKIPDKNFLSFLDMVGIEQLPGKSAEVPITLLLSKKSQVGGEIPAGTQVATTQTDTADAQVFETRKTFYATPAKLQRVISLIPDDDSYSGLIIGELPPKPADLGDTSQTITAFKKNDSPLQHILYLGNETLFGRKETITLKLTFLLKHNQKEMFTKNNLEWKKYNKEQDIWERIDVGDDDYDKSVSNEVTVTFEQFEGTDKYEVNEKEDYWIACYFEGEFGTGIEELNITGISGNISPPGSNTTGKPKIDAAFSNSNPIDLSKPFYPFGERPKYGDALYLGSKQGFSPDVTQITLRFTILPYKDATLKKIFQNITNDTTVTTTVEWQYLDKDEVWQSITTFEHTLEVQKSNLTITHKWNGNPTTNQDASFFGIDPNNSNIARLSVSIPPDKIGLHEWNQQENYWIRAILRSTEPYGKDATFESTTSSNQPFVVIGPTFIPPIIETIEIESYTYNSSLINISSIKTKNNFGLAEDRDYPFTPFISITLHPVKANTSFFAEKPALYMGFDQAFGDVYISIFFHLKEVFSAIGFPLERGNPHIVWEYMASDYVWKALDVEDDTADLTSSGPVAFTGPADSEKVAIFGGLAEKYADQFEPLYWYRARLADGRYDYPPEIKGIYLNTVMADNQTTSREDLVVGSGTGAAHQRLLLVRVPVLEGEVWVKEPERPGEEELEKHREEVGDMRAEDLIETKELTPGSGEVETWVRWLRVPNFLSSGPRSRHYTLDVIRGELSFGDGEQGLLPPAGKDNIIMRHYRTGGGENANKIAVPLAVKELKSSLPYVDKVFNVQNAVGGSDSWSLAETMRFGPQSIKNRGRAVTVEDYEWMTLQHFSQVARAKCLATRIPGEGNKLTHKPGAVTMIIVPKSGDRMPQPSKGLLKLVRDFLRAKALGNIFSDIYVIGPAFKKIGISALVRPDSLEESSIVERRVIKALEAFFHPLSGGEWGEGWEFGRAVYLSEIYAVIERIEGVDHVESVAFIGEPTTVTSVSVDDNSLVASGTHDIEIK